MLSPVGEDAGSHAAAAGGGPQSELPGEGRAKEGWCLAGSTPGIRAVMRVSRNHTELG